MNIIITILLIIAGFIALLLLLALFTKKGYIIERGIAVNKSRNEVFNYIKKLKNQDMYSKWVMTDPDMKKEFRGTDGTEGFVYAWNGNSKAGEGEQEIKKIREGERIDMEVRFKRPFKGLSAMYMTTGATKAPGSDDEQTNINWNVSSNMKYPGNIILLFMNMDKLLGRDMEISLGNLKRILEGR